MIYRACRKTPLSVPKGLLTSLSLLDSRWVAGAAWPHGVSSPVGAYQVPYQIVQIVSEDRPGTRHLQRLPQTFFGLVEMVLVRLQGANDPFGLAALAPDGLADGLGNV